MSFKRSLLTVFTSGVLLLVVTGCSKWLHEDPPASAAIEVNKDKTRCLKNWSEIMDRYLLAKSTKAEIEDFWNCLDSVVWHFQKNAKGNVPGVYAISELKRFVEEFFLKREIPESFMERFKDLKRAIFSGDRENFNQEDLSRLHLMLGEFKFGTSTMLPHMSYLNFTATSDQGLDEAIADLEKVVEHWMKNISTIHQSYKLEDLLRFWSEFKQVLEIKAFGFTDSKWENFLVTAKLVKSLILGAPGDEILQADWPLVYQRTTDAYTIGLLYHYRLKGKPLHLGAGVSALKKTSELILRGLKESIRRHPQERISSREFVDLAQVIKDNNWINAEGIRLSSLETGLVNLLRKVFYDQKLPIVKDEAFLSIPGMEFFEQELSRWLSVQTAINDVFGAESRITMRKFKEGWPETGDGNVEFAEIIKNTPYLLGINEGQQIVFSKRTKDYGLEVNAVSHLNWMTRVARVILKSYGRIETGVSVEGFDRFYRDVRDFGIDLGLLDPESMDSGVRTHFEANTFTDASDGNDIMSKLETIQEMQILLSGGLGANKVIDGVLQICQTKRQPCSRKDKKGFRIEASALEDFLLNDFATAFANLPETVSSYQELPNATKWKFVRMLVRESQKDLGSWLNISQIRHIVGLLHFAESIVLRYDEDRTGTIDSVEVRRAFDVFQGFLEGAIWQASQEKVASQDLFVGFVYFLKYGQSIVEPGGFWSKILTATRFGSLKYDIWRNNVSLNRFEIIRAMVMFRNFAGSK